MSEFNERNWADALVKLYDRSTRDVDYRQLCLTDPAAAVREVSDIELPPAFQFRFFDSRDSFVYSFLLPPVEAASRGAGGETEAIIRWATECTVPTTFDLP